MSDVAPPSLRDIAGAFGKIGLINFGGPAGQIALMHRVLVEEKRWIDEDRYLQALNFCTLLPGPEAQQLATFVGWKLRGVRGGLIAGGLFVAPGAVVILALAVLYAYAAHLDAVSAALLGVKAAVLAIVVEALLRLSKRALNAPLKRVIAVGAFAGLFLLQAPFPLILGVAAAIGLIAGHLRPQTLRLSPATTLGGHAPIRWRSIARTVLTWSAIWATPLAVAFAVFGPDHVLVRIGLFFSKLAILTFGGAYAVLAYMAQQAVEGYGWLTAGQMVDALGLAETTPGPLILVTEFVGFQAAFHNPAPFIPLVAGVLGAAMTLWVTFAPCFLWIFAGAPFIARMENEPRLKGALAAITAAVVGVIANLTLWFALHVLFGRFFEPWPGLSLPNVDSLDWTAAGLSIVAAVALFGFHLGVVRTLALCAALGLAAYFTCAML